MCHSFHKIKCWSALCFLHYCHLKHLELSVTSATFLSSTENVGNFHKKSINAVITHFDVPFENVVDKTKVLLFNMHFLLSPDFILSVYIFYNFYFFARMF